MRSTCPFPGLSLGIGAPHLVLLTPSFSGTTAARAQTLTQPTWRTGGQARHVAGAQRATVGYLGNGSGCHGQGEWELITQAPESRSKLVGFTSGKAGNTQSTLSRGSACSDL